jgi:hypothetical protein
METIPNTIASDKLQIDNLINQFFKVFNNTNQNEPDWTILHKICIDKIIIIKKTGLTETIYDLVGFIEPRRLILTNGTLINFEEMELSEETQIIGHIAQRHSKYRKAGNLNGTAFDETGTKLFQFMKTTDGWKITSLIWEDN